MMKKSLLIFLVIASFTSNYFVAQNIIAETVNSTGGPYPKNNMCPSSSKFIGVKITNKGPGSLPKNTQITITVKITGPNNTSKTFTEKFNTPTVIAFENSDWFTFVSPANIADLSKQGAYDFAIVATYTSDTPPTAADGFDAHEVLYVAGNVVGLVSVSPDRSLCKSAELDTIAYQISYNADSAYASNLPPGVFASWKSPRLKIFGNPTTATNSPFNYSVRATGACPSIYDSTLVGNITVKDLPVLAYIGNDTICEGFTSAVSPSSLGSWSSSAPSIATITNSGAITGLSTGKTLFTFTKTATGCFDTLRKFIVNPLPIVDPIAGPTKVCVNAKIQLTNTNKTGTWKSLDPARATINPTTGEVTGVSEGTSIIEYMVVSLGCTTVVTTTITVNKLPSVGSIFGTKQACIGLTTQLSNTTLAGVWTSGSTGVATISATGLVSGIKAGSSLISYTVTDGNSCVKSDTTTIRIYGFPTVAVINGTTTICESATTQLANATPNGVWSSGILGVATIDATGLVTAIKAGTSSISYVVTTNNCSTTVNSMITVNALPIVASITGSTNVCVGATSQLSNTTPGGIWTSVTPAVATINSLGLVSGLTPGTSQIDYTVSLLGCSTTKSTTVNTFSMPSVNQITGLTTVCDGATTLLSNTTPNGVWSSANQSVATISSQGIVTGISAGASVISYSLTLNGCTTTSTASLTVNSLPIVPAISGPTNVCVGENISLTNTMKLGQWSSSDNSIAYVNGAGVVTGVKGGAVTINYTFTSGGCSNASSTLIAVNNPPLVTPILGSTTVCQGGITMLTSASPGGVWTSTNQSVATISSQGIVTGISAGASVISYSLTLNGCTSVQTTSVTINARAIVAEITGDPSVCIGSTMNLQCITQGGVWASESPGVAAIDQTGLIKSVSPGTSVISYTKTVGACTNKKTDTITVYAMPVVAKISGKFDICAGLSTTLKNDTVGGIWSSSKPQIAIIDGFGKLTGVTAGSAKIYYAVTKNGCTTTDSVTVNVTGALQVSPITGNTTICENTTTDLKNNTPNGTWSSSLDAIATINSNTGVVTGIKSGQTTITYSVVTNGVCPQLAQTTVIVNAPPIVSEITGNSSLCQGSTTLLSNATLGGTWKSDTLFVATIDGTLGNLKALNLGVTNISYSVTQMGCSKMVTKKINVQAKENANFTYSSTNYCPSESDPTPVILGTKGGVFSAAPNGLYLNAITGKISLANSSKGNYAVTYKTPGFCSSERTWDIIIGDNSSNNLTITSSSGKDIFCMGDSLKLIAQGATKYLWNTGKTDNFITVKNPGKYTVTSKDAGCSATVSFDVKVDTLRLYMSVPSMVLVNNGFVTLNGNPKEGTFSGAGVNTNIFDPKLAGLGTKKIRFSYVSPNKCSAQIHQNILVYDTVSKNCTVTKYDTVKVTKFDTITIKNNVYDTVTITNNVTKYDTVKVTKFDTITVTNNVTKYDTITLTDTVSILKITFKLTTGIQANQLASMSLYPNPTTDVLHIEVGDAKALEGYRYRILDALGKEVYNELVKNAITEIPLKTLGAAGMYQFEVLDQKNTRIQANKIVLQ